MKKQQLINDIFNVEFKNIIKDEWDLITFKRIKLTCEGYGLNDNIDLITKLILTKVIFKNIKTVKIIDILKSHQYPILINNKKANQLINDFKSFKGANFKIVQKDIRNQLISQLANHIYLDHDYLINLIDAVRNNELANFKIKNNKRNVADFLIKRMPNIENLNYYIERIKNNKRWSIKELTESINETWEIDPIELINKINAW